jgi:ribonuclease HI
MMDEVLTIEFDGGSRGNPGPAGIGAVVRAQDGTPLVTRGRFIGRATNNVAEYRALILGLQEARKLGAKRVQVRGDSELIVRQMKGQYRVKNPDLRRLYDEAAGLMRQFDDARIEHNLRHHNTLADRLVNLALDRRADVDEVVGEGRGESGRGAAGEEDSAGLRPAAKRFERGMRLRCGRCGAEVEVVVPPRETELRAFTCACGSALGRAEG